MYLSELYTPFTYEVDSRFSRFSRLCSSTVTGAAIKIIYLPFPFVLWHWCLSLVRKVIKLKLTWRLGVVGVANICHGTALHTMNRLGSWMPNSLSTSFARKKKVPFYLSIEKSDSPVVYLLAPSIYSNRKKNHIVVLIK